MCHERGVEVGVEVEVEVEIKEFIGQESGLSTLTSCCARYVCCCSDVVRIAVENTATGMME